MPWALDPGVLFARAGDLQHCGDRRRQKKVELDHFTDVKRMPLVFPVPPLSTRGANLIAFFFATSYVVSLYLSKHTRPGNSSKPNGSNANAPQNRTRDDPAVIKARIVAASTSTTLSCVILFLLVWHIVDDLENVSDPNLVTTAT